MDPNITLNGPSSARKRNAIADRPMMAQHCCLLGSFVIFQVIRTSIAKKPYIFVNFLGGSGPPVPHSGSVHV